MIEVLEPAASLPVSVMEMRDQLRISDTAEDPLIERAIRAAVAKTERDLGVALMSQTWRITAPLDCDKVRLPISARIGGIIAVTARDRDGEETSIQLEDVVLRSTPVPYTVTLRQSASWPSNTTEVVVDVTCGYGLAIDVPSDLLTLVRFFAGWLFESRTPDESSVMAERCFRWLSSSMRTRMPV